MDKTAIPNVMPGYRTGGVMRPVDPVAPPLTGLKDYLLIVPLPEAMRSRVIQLRQQFQDSYGSSSATFLKPHVALLRFSQLEAQEEKIARKLQWIAMGIRPFRGEIDGFGSFPTHSIHLRLGQQPFHELLRELRAVQGLIKYDKDHKPHFITEPFLPVASRLQPWQYEKGWAAYRHKHFTGKFLAEGMLLLGRKKIQSGYQVIGNYPFLNLPVQTAQGQLF